MLHPFPGDLWYADFFCEPTGAPFNFVIFSDFHELFVLFKFLFGFFVFLSNCIFSYVEHGTLPETCIWPGGVIDMLAR